MGHGRESKCASFLTAQETSHQDVDAADPLPPFRFRLATVWSTFGWSLQSPVALRRCATSGVLLTTAEVTTGRPGAHRLPGADRPARSLTAGPDSPAAETPIAATARAVRPHHDSIERTLLAVVATMADVTPGASSAAISLSSRHQRLRSPAGQRRPGQKDQRGAGREGRRDRPSRHCAGTARSASTTYPPNPDGRAVLCSLAVCGCRPASCRPVPLRLTPKASFCEPVRCRAFRRR